MYNAKIPNENELPSSKQLLASTAIALLIALLLLVTIILPAEYGVDPIGAGDILGLTQMGEIKNQLAKEAEEDTEQLESEDVDSPTNAVEENLAAQTNTREEDSAVENTAAEVIPSETRSIQLKPGDAAEVKLEMKKAAIIIYEWSVDTGHVNFDTHGDGEGIKYFGYDKGRAITEDKGELQAEFDGKHGWFWRNRSNQTVTVTLIVSGDYGKIHRVL
ncbi:MAG: transmembrane anchor protein [Pseudomonadota bacterium]